MAADERTLAGSERSTPAAVVAQPRQWNTRDVSLDQRFSYYRDAICDIFMPLAPERPQPAKRDFRAWIASRPVGAMVVNQVRCDSHRVVRTKREIARSDDECVYLNYKRDGICRIAQADRSVLLRPGEVGLFDAMTPFVLDHEERPRLEVASFMIPYRAIRLHAPGFDPRRLPMRITDHPHFGRLIAETARILAEEEPLPDATVNTMSDMLLELLAAVLSTADETRPRTGLRSAALLQAIMRYMRDHRRDPELGIEAVALHFAISARYIQKLFAAEGLTFRDHLLAMRLDGAAGALRASAQGRATIASVAFDWGFRDLSQFNRTFRRRFDCTPAEWRSVSSVGG